jgi:negative regulator of flagellin synthesis FlgM
MEISGQARAHQLANVLLGAQEVDRSSAATRNVSPQIRQDQVNISDQAKEISRIKALVNESDTDRSERVDQIRSAIDSGTYDMNGRKIADALIRHVLTDAVL